MQMIALNGQEVVFRHFSNGEVTIDAEQLYGNLSMFTNNVVTFKYENDADLIKLMLVKRFIDEEKTAPTVLMIAYMPYSRMDRQEENTVFTLKYVTDFINQLNFHTVYVHEPHSDVTPALLNNCIVIDLTKAIFDKAIEEIGFDKEKDYVFYPDAGAQKRYGKEAGYKTLVGFKKRDFKTGKIKGLQVVGEMEPGRKVVIVDDLCSFGGTFVRSADELKEMGAGEIYLVVAHCEESIFRGIIPDGDLIEKVFTSDSILSESKHEKVKIMIPLGGTINANV